MATFEDGCYTCETGRTLLGRLMAGAGAMVYTRAALGAGTIPEGERPRTIREPPGYVMDGMISSVTSPLDGECQVTVQIDSAGVDRGFYLTGIMLYARDPESGDEVPYTYMSLENEPEWIRPATSTIRKINTFNLIAEVDAVENVSAVIDDEALISHQTLCRVMADAMRATKISVPLDVWAEEWNEINGTEAHATVPIEWATKDMIPLIHVPRSSTTIICECGLERVAEMTDGALHLYAAKIPMEPLELELLVLRPALDANWTPSTILGPAFSGADISGGVGSTLLPATETRLGGVKLGTGLKGSEDGTVSVDTANIAESLAVPTKDFKDALKTIYND